MEAKTIIGSNRGAAMRKACTNCGKKYENEEHCNQCGKTLGVEFICVKIRKESAHFCSRRCANKIVVAASYLPGPSAKEEPPQGYSCKKCGYHWMPPESELNPKLCPECASPDLSHWAPGQLKRGAMARIPESGKR